MFWLKGCPRCNGDLIEGKDAYGKFVSCVQCGHYLTQAEEVVARFSRLEGREVDLRQESRHPLIANRL